MGAVYLRLLNFKAKRTILVHEHSYRKFSLNF